MWQQKQVTKRPQISALEVSGDHIYWIASDDRKRDDEAHHSTLYRAAFDGDTEAIAQSLPASELLAVSDDAAFLWDEDEHLVLRASFDGDVEGYSALEGWLRGELLWSNGRLYFQGQLHAGGSGVAVFDRNDGTWEILLEVRDTTAGMRDRTVVADERVSCLIQKKDGWVLESHTLDGDQSTVPVDLQSDFLPRHMVPSGNSILIATENRILRLEKDGSMETVVQTELPAEDLVTINGKPAWLQAEVDESGAHEWRVRSIEDDEIVDLMRIDEPVVELAAGESQLAVITRPFEGGESAVIAAIPA